MTPEPVRHILVNDIHPVVEVPKHDGFPFGLHREQVVYVAQALTEVFIADLRNATTSRVAAVLSELVEQGTFRAARFRVLRKTDKRRSGRVPAAAYR